MFSVISPKNKEYVAGRDKKEISVRVNNIAIDLSLWLTGILVGLIPLIATTLLYPSEELKDLDLWARFLTEIDFSYSFLAGVTILTIEQLYVKSVNEKMDSLMKSTKIVCIVFEMIFIGIYTVMSALSVDEIEKRLGASIIDFNKFLIFVSVILAVILFASHAFSYPSLNKEKGV